MKNKIQLSFYLGKLGITRKQLKFHSNFNQVPNTAESR